MLKLYKKEQKDTYYAEYWIDGEQAIIHYGKIGHIRQTEKIENYLKSYKDEASFQAEFVQRFHSQGFIQISEEKFWILIQYPMKSLKGTKRDVWLKDRVTKILNSDLGWKGLGHVDGYDMGKTSNPQKQFALNIFCVVVDEAKGIKAIKSALRNNTCDFTNVKIAARPFSDDIEYTLKFSAKKKDLDFYV